MFRLPKISFNRNTISIGASLLVLLAIPVTTLYLNRINDSRSHAQVVSNSATCAIQGSSTASQTLNITQGSTGDLFANVNGLGGPWAPGFRYIASEGGGLNSVGPNGEYASLGGGVRLTSGPARFSLAPGANQLVSFNFSADANSTVGTYTLQNLVLILADGTASTTTNCSGPVTINILANSTTPTPAPSGTLGCSLNGSNTPILKAGSTISQNLQLNLLSGTNYIGFSYNGVDHDFTDSAYLGVLDFNSAASVRISVSPFSVYAVSSPRTDTSQLSIITKADAPIGQYTIDRLYIRNGTTKATCTNTKPFTISVTAGNSASSPPTVDLKVNGGDTLAVVPYGSSVTLSWTTLNSPTRCDASGDWSGTQTPSGGSVRVYPKSSNTTPTSNKYTLTCVNPYGSGNDSADVSVDAKYSLKIVAPSNASTVKSSQKVIITASNTTGAAVSLYINGKLSGSPINSTTPSWTWQVPYTISPTKYEVKVVAVSSSGSFESKIILNKTSYF